MSEIVLELIFVIGFSVVCLCCYKLGQSNERLKTLKPDNTLDEALNKYREKLNNELKKLYEDENKDIYNVAQVFCIFTALITISKVRLCHVLNQDEVTEEKLLTELDDITNSIKKIGKHE